MRSVTSRISVGEKQVELDTEDGSHFSFPRGDVCLLPLANSTVEELAVYVAEKVVETIGRERLVARHIGSITVGVAESPGQEARVTVAV